MIVQFFKHNRRLAVAIGGTLLLILAEVVVSLGLISTADVGIRTRCAGALVPLVVAAGWLAWTRRMEIRARNLAYSASWLLVWLAAVFLMLDSRFASARGGVVDYGLGITFIVGLCWWIWFIEQASQHYESLRETEASRLLELGLPPEPEDELHTGWRHSHTAAWESEHRVWNPLDTIAWYYGRKSPKLNQSMTMLTCYFLLCVLATVLVSLFPKGTEIFELPAGGGGGGAGGGQAQMASVAQQIKVKKVTRKKFVLNPLSSIIFAAPPIDDVKPLIPEMTAHLYSAGSGKGGAGFGSGSGIGFGDGDGSGFGSGTGTGKIQFIRIEYAGGDWAQDFGVGADDNMLREYGIRTGQKVAEHTSSRTISQLKPLRPDKSLPMVYMTGQQSITLSKFEVQTLREYLLEKHGMIFCDNGGSMHFHNQFFAMMRQVLPEVEPVRVPLDDILHRIPFPVPFLPYVAPHGGKDAWGWKVDGRWVTYYHPGDIGDAWSDGHSGVPRSVWDACYNLGANVIFYANAEYHKFLESQKSSGGSKK